MRNLWHFHARNSKSYTYLLPNRKDWPFEIYLDSNSDLKRALNVNAIPHTFLLNSKNEIVWQHTSYFDGDEEELFEEIQKLK